MAGEASHPMLKSARREMPMTRYTHGNLAPTMTCIIALPDYGLVLMAYFAVISWV